MTKTKRISKMESARQTVEELLSHGVPADRIIPLMLATTRFTAFGDGVLFSQVQTIIDGLCDTTLPQDDQ